MFRQQKNLSVRQVNLKKMICLKMFKKCLYVVHKQTYTGLRHLKKSLHNFEIKFTTGYQALCFAKRVAFTLGGAEV